VFRSHPFDRSTSPFPALPGTGYKEFARTRYEHLLGNVQVQRGGLDGYGEIDNRYWTDLEPYTSTLEYLQKKPPSQLAAKQANDPRHVAADALIHLTHNDPSSCLSESLIEGNLGRAKTSTARTEMDSLPTQHTCSFCGRKFIQGQGTMFVRRDGAILWFCSRRCRIYMTKHGKDPRKYKWTGRHARGTR